MISRKRSSILCKAPRGDIFREVSRRQAILSPGIENRRASLSFFPPHSSFFFSDGITKINLSANDVLSGSLDFSSSPLKRHARFVSSFVPAIPPSLPPLFPDFYVCLPIAPTDRTVHHYKTGTCATASVRIFKGTGIRGI